MIATVETSFVESKTIITDDETTTPTTTSTTIKKESRKRKCAILTKLTDTPLELIPLPAHVNMDKVINYNISQADETYALNRQVEVYFVYSFLLYIIVCVWTDEVCITCTVIVDKVQLGH